MTNFALIDFVGICVSLLVFPCLTFFPGYLLAYSLNIWQFRSRTVSFQLPASVALSLGVGPTVTFLLASVGNWLLVCDFYGIATMLAILTLIRAKPRVNRTVKRAVIVGLLWSLFAGIWLMDWQFGGKVYFPIYAYDYSTRSAMVHSLAAFGLPAQTPFFHPGHPVALHYHFLWLLQCALVHWLAPSFISGRAAFIAGAIWCGLGLMSTAALAMRILMQRRSWNVIALLAVTGLDIIPAGLLLLFNRLHWLGMLPPSAEWWNEQVDGWIYTTLWEPHYICALVGCVTGLLLLWQTKQIVTALIAACCFATAVGSGIFVAMVFAAFLLVWMLINIRHSFWIAVAGVLATLASWPYLQVLNGPAQNVATKSLLTFFVRPFSPLQVLLAALQLKDQAKISTLYLLALPLNYFLELGFFAACVWIGYRRKLVPQEKMLVVMAVCSMVICTFVRSGATPNNDLGWRGLLIAQFALLVLSAAYLEQIRSNRYLKLLLILGVAGSAYDLSLTRLFASLSDAHQVPRLSWLAQDDKLGARTKANREAYAWLRKHSSLYATLGQNPDVDSVDIFYGLYADRRILAGDRTCTINFGGTHDECYKFQKVLADLYSGRQNGNARLSLPVDFYIVKDSDPVWSQPGSWVWKQSPLFANEFVRIFAVP